MINRLLIIFILLICAFSKPAYSEMSNLKVQNIFNTGRAIGDAYYNLVNIYQGYGVDDIKFNKTKYQHAFQTLSIIDLISEDLQLSNQSICLLKNVRFNLYQSLNDEKINYAMLDETMHNLNQFYSSLNLDLENTIGVDAKWYSDLGFYSAFQLDAINSNAANVLMLESSQNIYLQTPTTLPSSALVMIDGLKTFDKPSLSSDETKAFKQKLASVISYFSQYPNEKQSISDLQQMKGYWQGIMINPYGQKYNIILDFDDIKNAKLSIIGIAENIPLSNIDVIDNYFSFTFKPIGTEKFNVRFNAKINNGMFSGNITNSLNEQGYWVLTKTPDKTPLVEEKINSLSTYLKK